MGDITTDLLCFGNALLDMVLPVSDGQLLTKYHLLPDNQIEASEDQKPLFDEVFNRLANRCARVAFHQFVIYRCLN